MTVRRAFITSTRGGAWVAAPDAVAGPWQASSPPAAVVALAAEAQAEALAQGQAGAANPGSGAAPLAQVTDGLRAAQGATLPQIIVATEPTELIVTDGEPVYTPLPGNDLLYLSNTSSTVFLDINAQRYYTLLSGRWFSATTLSGEWAFVAPDQLPPAFARIPSDSLMGDALAHVAGTAAATEAVAEAQVPQTTGVDRSTTRLEVVYDGAPPSSGSKPPA